MSATRCPSKSVSGAGILVRQLRRPGFRALARAALDSPIFPALINLMYLNRPYHAHTALVRLIYQW